LAHCCRGRQGRGPEHKRQQFPAKQPTAAGSCDVAPACRLAAYGLAPAMRGRTPQQDTPR
jgi:hypothetical protein